MERSSRTGLRSQGVDEVLGMLDGVDIAAIAVEPSRRCIRAVNETFSTRSGLEPEAVEEAPVHEIVVEKHHERVTAMLEALAHGANVGPTPVALQRSSVGASTPSVWGRVPGVHEPLDGAVVLFCQPLGTLEDLASARDVGLEVAPGFGRIPIFPRPW